MKKKRAVSTSKSSVAKRTPNSQRAKAKTSRPGMPSQPFSQQDPQRRLGNFVGAGEPARKGSRGRIGKS